MFYTVTGTLRLRKVIAGQLLTFRQYRFHQPSTAELNTWFLKTLSGVPNNYRNLFQLVNPVDPVEVNENMGATVVYELINARLLTRMSVLDALLLQPCDLVGNIYVRVDDLLKSCQALSSKYTRPMGMSDDEWIDRLTSDEPAVCTNGYDGDVVTSFCMVFPKLCESMPRGYQSTLYKHRYDVEEPQDTETPSNVPSQLELVQNYIDMLDKLLPFFAAEDKIEETKKGLVVSFMKQHNIFPELHQTAAPGQVHSTEDVQHVINLNILDDSVGYVNMMSLQSQTTMSEAVVGSIKSRAELERHLEIFVHVLVNHNYPVHVETIARWCRSVGPRLSIEIAPVVNLLMFAAGVRLDAITLSCLLNAALEYLTNLKPAD